MFKAVFFAAASSILLSAAPVLAADMASGVPAFARTAVDGFNGKLEAFFAPRDYRIAGGRGDSDNALGLAGSFSIPLGQSFGMQIDALAASRDGLFVGGSAGHLFWRDPSNALFGVYGSYLRSDKDSVAYGRLGFEAEYYMSRFTIAGIAGFERTVADRTLAFVPGVGVVTTEGSRNRGFVATDLSWYATDNFKLSVGYRYWVGRSLGAAGLEYMVPTGQGVSYSFFAEGRAGESRYLAGMAGVRVYFGHKDKTLIRRHREDDPPNYLRDDLFAPRNTKVRPGEPDGCGLACEG
ncbi:MAG: hypothetical protein K2Y29_13925 [Beijerinckiaceae bacterium]|nr:hypothetical protein [Beijerinckiaceae bacterium]